MTLEETTPSVNPKAPQQGAQAPQQKVDINTLTFELKLPGSVVMDVLNSLKMASDKFKSSFDFINKNVIEWIKSHLSQWVANPETTKKVEETKKETKKETKED